MNEIMIFCCYYNRPKMVVNALKSIQKQTYQKWKLVFVDDSSEVPGDEIVKEIFGNDDRVVCYNTNDKDKTFGQSIFGKYWNYGMMTHNSDIGIMLCDDDMLCADYLKNLNEYYTTNRYINYSYGHVIPYDPFNNVELSKNNILNRFNTDINPVCSVDASQVSWRIPLMKFHKIFFSYPKTKNLDEDLYRQLYNNFGTCKFNGIDTQYKGIHVDQLCNRSEYYKVIDI